MSELIETLLVNIHATKLFIFITQYFKKLPILGRVGYDCVKSIIIHQSYLRNFKGVRHV